MSTAVLVGLLPMLAVFTATRARAQAATLPYDHIHVNVPDPAAAANWYETHFGGKRINEAPDRLMFGSTRFKTTIQFSYVEGPAGTKIELVERPGLRPGE